MIDRRKWLAVSAAFATTPAFAFAQQSARPARIGWLTLYPASADPALDPFKQGLKELGHVEGRTYVLEIRSAEFRNDRIGPVAIGLARLKCDVIWTHGLTPLVDAILAVTESVPIVFGTTLDPVAIGWVRSLRHPGGRITGPSLMTVDLMGKQLEYLRAIVPALTRVALFMAKPAGGHELVATTLESAGSAVGVRVSRYPVASAAELGETYKGILREKASALIVPNHSIFLAERMQIADFGIKNRLPVMYPQFEAVRAGCLISYGANIADVWRRSASYVDRILKGARPADLPVEQPTKFHLAVNMRTAKAIGLTIPQELLLRADEVIE